MEEKNNTHTGAEDGPYMGDGSAGSTDRREERSDPGAAPIDAVRDVGPIYPPGCDPRAPGLPSPENVEKVRRALGYLNANFDGNKDFYALANVVNGTQGGFNPDWLLSALVVLKLSDPRMHTRRYLLGILRGFGQAGGPTPEEQARAEAVFNPVSSDPAAAASAAESEEVLNARATARMIAYLKNNPTPSYG